MITDKQFAEILKPLDFEYDTSHDNIYVGDDELIAVVDSIPDGDDWKRDYFVVMVRIPDMDDERTLALRAVCVLHNIEVRELKDSDQPKGFVIGAKGQHLKAMCILHEQRIIE